jgi:hypothetical protein
VCCECTDAGSAILSVFVINLGNSWDSVMFAAEETHKNQWLFIFFIVMHFLGVFLLLNIIQSLFVFTFSTFLNHSEFLKTAEFEIQRQLQRLHKLGTTSFKKIRRAPKLELLMLNSNELELKYRTWLFQQYAGNSIGATKIKIDFGSSLLKVDGIQNFLFQDDLSAPSAEMESLVSSMKHNEEVKQFLQVHLGAKVSCPILVHSPIRPLSFSTQAQFVITIIFFFVQI